LIRVEPDPQGHNRLLRVRLLGPDRARELMFVSCPAGGVFAVPTVSGCRRICVWTPDEVKRVDLLRPSLQTQLIWAASRLVELIAKRVNPRPLRTASNARSSPERGMSDSAVIVATRDQPRLFRLCWETILAPAIASGAEVVVVDHDNRDPEALALIEQARCAGARITTVQGPFNYSAFINIGVSTTDRERLFLINDDVSADGSPWWPEFHDRLDAGAAVVGSRLVYPDGSLQHAGVVLGMGVVGHIGRGRSPTAPDPWNLFSQPRRVSAVTGACMAVRRSDFESVGGLDETLRIEFSDIDFCLKLGRQREGCWVLNAPALVHHESATRGNPADGPHAGVIQRDRARFLARWGNILAWEPYLDPRLSRRGEAVQRASKRYAVASSRK